MKVELVAKTLPLIENVSTGEFAAYVARIGKPFFERDDGWYHIKPNGTVIFVFEPSKAWRFVKLHTDKDGYKYITTYSEGKRKNHKVHRLVAVAFLDLKNDQFVNHINGKKDDNRLENLEVCTRSENMKHAVITGLLTNCIGKGEAHNTCKHSYADVQEIRRLYKETKISMRGLAKQFNCGSGYISDVINMKIRVEA